MKGCSRAARISLSCRAGSGGIRNGGSNEQCRSEQFGQAFGQGISSAVTECLGSDLQAGGCLTALVFVAVDPGKNIFYQNRIKPHVDDILE